MPEKITPISGATLIKVFEATGFEVTRQKGSHVVLRKPGIKRPLVVPLHKEVKIGVILSNLRTAGISRSAYLELLEQVR